MATALAPHARSTREGEHRFLLTGVGWEGYEAALEDDRRRAHCALLMIAETLNSCLLSINMTNMPFSWIA